MSSGTVSLSAAFSPSPHHTLHSSLFRNLFSSPASDRLKLREEEGREKTGTKTTKKQVPFLSFLLIFAGKFCFSSFPSRLLPLQVL